MGFFDDIKKTFGSGGIKVHIDTPDSFTWSDGSIPAAVTLSGHKTEPRTVTELRFTFAVDQKDDDSTGTVTLNFTHSEPIEVPPFEDVAVEIEFPLGPDVPAPEGGGFMGGLMKAVGTISRNAPWYLLKVHTTVEGAGASKIASNRIRNVR